MTDRVGQQLGNYRMVSLLGRGSFAEVYLGEHVYLHTQAAIKVMFTQLSKDDMALFLAEARTLAQLIHPNIVRVLDFGVDSSTPFLVLDYAPNGTLRDRHPSRTQLPLSTIVLYMKQLAGALLQLTIIRGMRSTTSNDMRRPCSPITVLSNSTPIMPWPITTRG